MRTSGKQQGNYNAYDYFGHHHVGDEIIFRLWAPGADEISLVGDFNFWTVGEDVFRRISENGIWEARIKADRALPDCKYKFAVTSAGGTRLKADPYAFFGETLTHTASIIWRSKYKWRDEAYMSARGSVAPSAANIYAIHPASWRTRDGRDNTKGDAYLNFREIAEQLIPYMKKMGYTHVELTPIMEHPDDRSTGYRTCSYYAPSSRYGNPDDFKFFVDELHRAGLGVILDGVPDRFPKDEHGLYRFDGFPLYEKDTEGQEATFDLDKPEVETFLISNALFWLKEYHVDGLCVASSECTPLKEKLREILAHTYPSAMLITGNNVRNITHDDVNFLDRENIRAKLVLAMLSQSKKRTVMGCEFAMQRRWDYLHQLDWYLTDLEAHDRIQHFVSKLNHFHNNISKECWLSDDSEIVTEGDLHICRRGALTAIANLSAEVVNYSTPEEHTILFGTEDDYDDAPKNSFSIQPHGAVIIKPIKRKERHNV